MKIRYAEHLLDFTLSLILVGFSSIGVAEEVSVLPEHLKCEVTGDCQVVKDPCSPSCSCGVPVAKEYFDHYATRSSGTCKNIGAVCDMFCPSRRVDCVNNRCQFAQKPNSLGKVKLQVDGKWYERDSLGALVPIPE